MPKAKKVLGRNVSIEEARLLSEKTDTLIHWRPKPELPEELQYATVMEA